MVSYGDSLRETLPLPLKVLLGDLRILSVRVGGRICSIYPVLPQGHLLTHGALPMGQLLCMIFPFSRLSLTTQLPHGLGFIPWCPRPHLTTWIS